MKKSKMILSSLLKALLFIIYVLISGMVILIVGMQIPIIADYFANAMNLNSNMPTIVLAVDWGIPVLFVSAFLFVATFFFLKWFRKFMLRFSRSIVNFSSSKKEEK